MVLAPPVHFTAVWWFSMNIWLLWELLKNAFRLTHNPFFIMRIYIILKLKDYFCVCWKYFSWYSLCEKCPYSEFFWFVFSEFGLNTERPYSFWLRENRTRKTPNTDTFHAVTFTEHPFNIRNLRSPSSKSRQNKTVYLSRQ